MPLPHHHPIQFTASDGLALHGLCYEPSGQSSSTTPSSTLLIAGGMGIPCSKFYKAFAEHCIRSQLYGRVVCFDYRGIGLSRPPETRESLVGFHAPMSMWGYLDLNAAILLSCLHGIS